MDFGPILRAMSRRKARFLLIVFEVALTLAIVTNAVGMILDARSEMARPSGFDDEHLIWVDADNFGQAFEDQNFVLQTVDADADVLRALPGVKEASHTHFLPWRGGGSSVEVLVEGRDDGKYRTQIYAADPGIVDTLGVEIVAGRGLDETDYGTDTDVELANALISQGLAELLFPDGDGLGQRVYFSPDGVRFVIVGVFADFFNPYGWPIGEYALFAPGPSASASGHSFLVRAEPGRVDQVVGDIEAALMGVEDERSLTVRTIAEIKTRYHAPRRLIVNNLNMLMILLITVTALGIIGLTSFSVTERRRQIGTRRALGATKQDIVRYFLVENWLVTTAGVVLGVVLAVVLNGILLTTVAGAKLAWDVVLGGVVLLWLVGFLATLGPALRGADLPPALATQNV